MQQQKQRHPTDLDFVSMTAVQLEHWQQFSISTELIKTIYNLRQMIGLIRSVALPLQYASSQFLPFLRANPVALER
jgi:hypothetical protein